MSKIIYSGLESSGKSLKLAMVVSDIAWRNKQWKEKTGIVRTIASNLFFSEDFYNLVVNDYGLEIKYWENLDDLVSLEQCDVIIDEVANYFDARMWAELSLEVRRWLTQGAKSGIELYGSAQDFGQVDKAFRRLTNHLYLIKKLIGSPRPSATRPPVKKIWGVCLMTELDPQGYDEDRKKEKTNLFQIPSVFTIQRKYCEIFDTTQKIKKSKALLYRHEERYCSDPNCTFHKVIHV